MFLHCSENPIVAQLGFRFWDPVSNAQIADGLEVTARTVYYYSRKVKAFQTPSGNYVFQGLPGLHDFEYPFNDNSNHSNRKEMKFIIAVKDNQHRFLPFAFLFKEEIPLEYTGIYRNNIFTELNPASPPEAGLPVIYLYSSPTRQLKPGLAVVRCQLKDYSTKNSASHAFIEINIKGKKWFGMANDKGNAAVYFPFPTVDNTFFNTSPPMSASKSLFEQKWPLSISFKYSPGLLRDLPAISREEFDPERLEGKPLPDLSSIISQRRAHILINGSETSIGATAVFELNEQLAYGQEVVLRTYKDTDKDNGSDLFIEADPTSP